MLDSGAPAVAMTALGQLRGIGISALSLRHTDEQALIVVQTRGDSRRPWVRNEKSCLANFGLPQTALVQTVLASANGGELAYAAA